jgi:trehalose 2-sulfotransferase
MSGYVICATPRSGSTLLCALLRTAGAGAPGSWFRRQNMAEFAAGWGLRGAEGGFDPEAYLAAAIREGRGGSACFALRLMWDHLGALSEVLGKAEAQAEDLAAGFGPLCYVFLRRRDLVAQAVSRQRAESSGIWHLGIEEAAQPLEPRYDFASILGYLREAEADAQKWQAWFAANALTPLQIWYEDLAAEPQAVARQVLAYVQPDLSLRGRLDVANRKMASAESAQWAERFRAEMQHAGR